MIKTSHISKEFKRKGKGEHPDTLEHSLAQGFIEEQNDYTKQNGHVFSA